MFFSLLNLLNVSIQINIVIGSVLSLIIEIIVFNQSKHNQTPFLNWKQEYENFLHIDVFFCILVMQESYIDLHSACP